MTANVSSRIRFRSGKVAGRASAAASETAPRRPAQLTTKVSRRASRGSLLATTRRGEPGSRLPAKTQTNAGDDDDDAHERDEAERPRAGGAAAELGQDLGQLAAR